MMMGRTEGLSLNSGDSRILWDNHIKQLLGVSGSEALHWVGEVGGYSILKLLIEATSGLRLTELIRWSIVHTGLNEGVPGELPLGSVVIDLEILLIADREGGESGLVAIRPILAME